MTTPPRQNRFETSRKAVLGVLFSFIGLALLGASFFTVKIVRDEINRGFERHLMLREPRPSSDLSATPPKDLLAVADGLEAKPYRLRVDENGFIKPSAVNERADASVVFLGGSTTECHYMDEEARFPYLVGRSLESSLGKRVNSFNTGNAGNNTMHCVLLLQGKVLPMKPKAVVLMECVNDVSYLMQVGHYWTNHATRSIIQDKEYNPVKTWIIRHLIGHTGSGPVQGDEFAGVKAAQTGLGQQAIQDSYRKNIELFVYLCRLHGITPVLMTQFNRVTETLPENLERQMEPMRQRSGISYEVYRANYTGLNETMRKVAAEQKVLLVDLDRLVPKTKDYMYDVVHLNANGSRFVADIVAKALEPVLR